MVKHSMKLDKTDHHSPLTSALKALESLHFEQVLELTAQNSEAEKENPFWYWLIRAKALRGLYQYNKALKTLERMSSDTPVQISLLETEKGKLLFSMGKVAEAQTTLQNAVSNLSLPFTPELPLALASLYAQEGMVDQALEELDPVIEYFGSSHQETSAYTELCTLLGDLYTFKNEFRKAKFWYENGLQSIPDCIPKNWQPLRFALLENNLADLYEQEEDWPNALECYKKAKEQLMKLDDDQISDLSSYKLEILFSYANVLANMDLYDEAMKEMEKAHDILQNNPPMQLPYFTARYSYFLGLFHLYRQQDAEDRKQASHYLKKAFDIQKDLVKKGLDKQEHAAKSAYYYAYSLPDQDPYKNELYHYALPVFKKLCQKEPVFYLDSIAQIYNDLGRMEMERNPSQAEEYLKLACQVYQDLHDQCPNELFSSQSLLIALLNLMSLYMTEKKDRKREGQEAEKIYDLLESVKNLDPQGFEQLLSIADEFTLRHPGSVLETVLNSSSLDAEGLH